MATASSHNFLHSHINGSDIATSKSKQSQRRDNNVIRNQLDVSDIPGASNKNSFKPYSTIRTTIDASKELRKKRTSCPNSSTKSTSAIIHDAMNVKSYTQMAKKQSEIIRAVGPEAARILRDANMLRVANKSALERLHTGLTYESSVYNSTRSQKSQDSNGAFTSTEKVIKAIQRKLNGNGSTITKKNGNKSSVKIIPASIYNTGGVTESTVSDDYKTPPEHIRHNLESLSTCEVALDEYKTPPVKPTYSIEGKSLSAEKEPQKEPAKHSQNDINKMYSTIL